MTGQGAAAASLTLGAVVEGERNSFNAVRLLAAAAVLVSHSFALTRPLHEPEPLLGITPYTLGQHAVNIFFVLSGLMLSRSYALDPHLGRFAAARVLRVFPGLIACGVVVAAVIGALSTPLPLASYYTDPATLAYPLRVAVEFNRAPLPRVFDQGIDAGSPNLSLWTIKYELIAYAGFIVGATVGAVQRNAVSLLVLALCIAGVIGLQLSPGLVERWPALVPQGRFFMSFMLGVVAYQHRRRIPLRWSWLAAMLIVVMATHETTLEQPTYITFIGYLALLLGGVTMPSLSRLTRRTDLSYGLYLYAWPVQQMLLHRWPGLDTGLHILSSLGIALPLAALSWLVVERPALGLKRTMRKSVGDKHVNA